VTQKEDAPCQTRKTACSTIAFEAYGNRVVIDPDEVETRSPGGIVIPPSAAERQKPATGTVVAIGEGQWHHGMLLPLTVKMGVKVAFIPFAGAELKVGGKKYLIMRDEDVLGAFN